MKELCKKILVTLPKKYEAKISSLKELKDLSSISLVELVNALQTQEQRRMMRQENFIEGAFQAKAHKSRTGKERRNNRKQNNHKSGNNTATYKSKDETYPPCPYCKKTNHPQKKSWWRQDIQCRKCGQIGHMEKICKSQKHKKEGDVVTEQYYKEQLFVTTCFATNNSSSDSWLIDSGVTNDQKLFKELDKTDISNEDWKW